MSGPLITQEQESIRKALADCGDMLKKDASSMSAKAQALTATCARAPDPHQLILDRLSYHRKSINELDALFNALPRTLPLAAANGLAQLLLDARPRY